MKKNFVTTFATSKEHLDDIEKLSSMRKQLLKNSKKEDVNKIFVKAGIFTKENDLTEEYKILNYLS